MASEKHRDKGGSAAIKSRVFRPLLCTLALLAAALLLFTRQNDFPFFYHPDEPDKVRQVMDGDWNFHHPMLMLGVDRLVTRTLDPAADEQRVVVIGRWVSAFFAATAIVALAGLGYFYRGWFGFFGAGFLLLLHHQLFELSHYMKEDTALLMGVALSLLALALFWQRRDVPTLLFFALACALAVGGKYLGIVMFLLALPVVFLAEKAGFSRARRLIFFGVVFVLAIAVINLPLLENLGRFQHSFDSEMKLVVHGQSTAAPHFFNFQYTSVFLDNTTPALWLFLAAHLFTQWQRRRTLTLPEWIITLFPFAYMALLSCSPKTNDRYFLPASALFTFLAALGALDLATRWPKIPATLFLAVGLAFQLPSLLRYEAAFRHDDRKELRAWLDANLPASALLAQDYRSVKLPIPGKNRSVNHQEPLRQRVLDNDKLAADFGSIDALKNLGVTHVIVSQNDYGKYFLKSAQAKKGGADDFRNARAFYENLFRDEEMLWERPRGTVIYLHPGFRVYRLR